MKNRVALHTLGCKLNFSETSTIGSQFASNGYKVVDFNDNADIYVFNTCTVTENAEKECRQLVRRALRKNPEAFVIVTGCYAQLRPEEIAGIGGVDVVLGSKEKFKLFSYIENFEKKDLSCIHVSSIDNLNDFGSAHSTDPEFIGRTRAYLKIQDGCDYKCTFCTIPLARGKSRSMEPEAVLQELKNLVDNGYKEIILTGVNVGDYGKNYNTDLYQLLTKIVNIPGDFRIRISSIEPNLLSDEIIELTASNNKLCNHFHIPLQSGSSKILHKMKRRYKVEDYEKLIYKLNDRIENIGIGVDVIVGFPGETEKDFLDTYYFLRDLPVTYFHVFTYSERPDTEAIKIPGTIDVFERRKRNNMLRILSDKKKLQFYRNMTGKKLNVLFETENADGTVKGFSSNYVRVSQEFHPGLINQLSEVLITEIDGDTCTGNILEQNNSVDLIAG